MTLPSYTIIWQDIDNKNSLLYPMYQSRSIGEKGTDLVLETQYPTKNDTQKAITESNKAKAVAASHDELLDDEAL